MWMLTRYLLWIGELKKHHHYLMIQFIVTLTCGCLAFKSSVVEILFSYTCFTWPAYFRAERFYQKWRNPGFWCIFVLCMRMHVYASICKSVHKCECRSNFPNLQSQPSRLCHLCGSIPSESRWIINAHILFFTDGEIIWDGFFFGAPNEFISCLRCQYYFQILLR